MVMTADLVDSIPADELADSETGRRVLSESPAAKRARERRAGIKAGTITVKPHRGGRRAGRPGRPARAPKSLYPEIAAALSLVNSLASMTPLGPKHELTGTVHIADEQEAAESGGTLAVGMQVPDVRLVSIGDTLDEIEITQLSKALDAQCQRSPRFRKQVERILGASAGGQLFSILGMIAIRRAARHGIAPPQLDPMFGRMLAGGDLGSLAAFVPPSDPDERNESGERAPQPDDEETDFESMP